MTIGETVWVRRDRRLTRPADDRIAQELPVRRIDYRTAIPGDERSWVISTLVTPGEGGLDTDETELIVALFDAIMGTWTWNPDQPEMS